MGMIGLLYALQRKFGAKADPAIEIERTFAAKPHIVDLVFARATVEANYVDAKFYRPDPTPSAAPAKAAITEFLPNPDAFNIAVVATMDDAFDYIAIRLYPKKDIEDRPDLDEIADLINKGMKEKYTPAAAAPVDPNVDGRALTL